MERGGDEGLDVRLMRVLWGFTLFRPIIKPMTRCSDLVFVGFWPVSGGFLRLFFPLER